MNEIFFINLSAIIVLGIISQWVAWRIQIPSILILLVVGFIAGPITGFIDPEALLGDSLFPIISISVAIILFEGGLSLHFQKLRGVRNVVRRLISIGILTTWIIATLAAYYFLNLDLGLSLLLGAILVVTGPTVIIPLLQHLRLVSRIGSVARWEGIINDPIGASLAVLVFEAILVKSAKTVSAVIIFSVLKTLILGVGLGVLGAFLMIFLLKRYWIPDFLQSPVTLMVVIFIFAISNFFQDESGLFAVTMMGIVMANQKYVPIQHIVDFKENLRVLLISGLFILLAARIEISDMDVLNLNSFIFLVILILVARPIAVILSTIRTNLNWREKIFLIWMAPRGIVAAAVSSVFALFLAEKGFEDAHLLTPVTFLVIIGTVAFYGLTAGPVVRWLGLATHNPQGVLMVGAHDWARNIAKVLMDNGIPIIMADSNWKNITTARIQGIETYYGNILSEKAIDEIDIGGLGRLMALTSNDEVNHLAALHFTEIFGRADVYQLASGSVKTNNNDTVSIELTGRLLFGKDITFDHLIQKFRAGAEIKTTSITEEFSYLDYQNLYQDSALPLFLLKASQQLDIFATDNIPTPEPGDAIISLVNSSRN